ncbi:hypothetical protein AQUCO_05700019v1 [Aquilegia coerulea]|uniref:CSC1-like protein ERD4 n=2 Tax=Aquilegia coerulea TaxID=218851 RepID=A0A2G5CFG4_AQUCA|nr:hypothetical protein AQUCO_05700019v1 [Aquilegia coerulea]
MDLSSFLTSLTTSFIIFVIFVLIFTWLSRKPGNSVIYYPNRIVRGLEPYEGVRTRSPFAWIKESITSTEADIISISGVDTAVYFVFLSTVLGILVSSGTLLLPSLLPIAGTAKSKDANSNSNFTSLERLSMANVEEKSPRLWAFLLATYVVSFFTLYMLWKAYNHVSELRGAALSAPGVKPEQYAILVRDIPAVPEGQTRKEQVDSYFRSLHADTFYRSMVVTDNKEVNKIWEDLKKYRKKLARAEAIFAASKTTGKPEGTRPMNKKSFLCGEKVDTIDYCNKMIDTLVSKLETEQKNTIREKQQSSAFVFFTNRIAATSAAQTIHAKKVDTWTVVEAPEPRQIIWSNLKMKFYQRQLRQDIVYVIVALTVLFYMIPITFISAFTTLKNLKKILPFLKPVVDQPEVKTVLEAYLPQVALIVFLALLPKLLMFLSKAEGIPSLSHVVRASSGKYFYFIILNVFIGVTISGTLLRTIKEIQKDATFKKIVDLLGKNLPLSATFFLTFVALKFFIGYGLELSRLVPFIIFHLKRKYLCKTEAEVKEAWAPGDINYATRVPNDLLIVTIVLCYSVIAPVIIPFGVAYFGVGWLVLRNQALKVYVPSYESYGRMWPHMHGRILAALIIYQVTMIGYFSIKKFLYSPFAIPLPIFSIIFALMCRRKFYNSFRYTPLEVVCAKTKETPNLEAIYKAYIPPCLSSYKFDETQEFGHALSAFSKTGSSV